MALGRASRLRGTREKCNKTFAGLRHDKAVRLKHVALEEMAGEDEAGGDIAFANRRCIID